MKLSTAETARRIEMYRDGCTFAEIGAACGVCPDAVRLHMQRIGEHTPDPRRQRTIPAANRRRAVELYQAGYTLNQIERVTRVSRFWLYGALHREGIATRSPKVSAANRRRWAAQKETS